MVDVVPLSVTGLDTAELSANNHNKRYTSDLLNQSRQSVLSGFTSTALLLLAHIHAS